MKHDLMCQKLKLAMDSERYSIDSYRKVARELLGDKDIENAKFFVDLSNEREQHIQKINEKLKEVGC